MCLERTKLLLSTTDIVLQTKPQTSASWSTQSFRCTPLILALTNREISSPQIHDDTIRTKDIRVPIWSGYNSGNHQCNSSYVTCLDSSDTCWRLLSQPDVSHFKRHFYCDHTARRFSIQATPVGDYTTKRFSIQATPVGDYAARRFPIQATPVGDYTTKRVRAQTAQIRIASVDKYGVISRRLRSLLPVKWHLSCPWFG